MDLFQDVRKKNLAKVAPLAVRMRPRTLDEFVGQQHFLGPGKLLRRMLEADRLTSVIFYGPPGTGKTTLAQLIATLTPSHFEQANAAGGGVQAARALPHPPPPGPAPRPGEAPRGGWAAPASSRGRPPPPLTPPATASATAASAPSSF